MPSILVYAELSEGKITSTSLELMAKAVRLRFAARDARGIAGVYTAGRVVSHQVLGDERVGLLPCGCPIVDERLGGKRNDGGHDCPFTSEPPCGSTLPCESWARAAEEQTLGGSSCQNKRLPQLSRHPGRTPTSAFHRGCVETR